MFQKFNNIPKFFSKKRHIFLLSFFLLAGLFLMITVAHAFLPPPFMAVPAIKFLSGINISPIDMLRDGVARSVSMALLSGFFMIMQSIGTMFLGLSSLIFNWTISENFINVKFTDNIFVNEGWNTVRNFTNMFFILVMVIIGLGTSLRIREYEAKKTLPALIAVALLINFTPVICGFFIDASNILMNFFLSATGTGIREVTEKLGNSWDFYGSMGKSGSNANPATVAGYGFAMLTFTFIAAFTYLIYAFLFAARYVMLWTLIILSPLAFLCYILPSTKKGFTMWWSSFSQWCFVGIGGAFFLYLSDILIASFATVASEPAVADEWTGIASFLPFLIPIFFLMIGLYITMSTSATGANYIISGVTGQTKIIGGKTLSMARRTKTGARMEKWGAMQMEKLPGGPMPGTYKARKLDEMKKTEEKYARVSTTDLKQAKERRFLSNEDKLGIAGTLFNKGELNDQDTRKYITNLKTAGGNLKEKIEKRPDLSPLTLDIKKHTGESEGAFRTRLNVESSKNITEQVQKTAPREFRRETQAKALENIDVIFAMGDRQTKEMGKNGTQEKKNTLKEFDKRIQKNGDLHHKFTKKWKGSTQQEKDRFLKFHETIQNDPNFS